MKRFYLFLALLIPILSIGQATQCTIEEPGNNFENGEFGLHLKHIANDFDVPEGTTMSIEKIIPNIINNISTADITFYEDDNGQPGAIITSFTAIVPTSQTQVSSNFGLPWYEVELDLPTAVALEGLAGGSKYWVGIIVAIGTDAGSNFWEVKSNGTTVAMHSSLDGGATWTPSASGFDGVFNLIGMCEAAASTMPCEIVEIGNNFENAEFGLHVKHIANDFDIDEGDTMHISKVIPTIVNNIGAADIFIYEDNNGQPGNIITSFAGVIPTSQTQVSTNFGLPWYEVELDLPSTVTLEGLPGGSKYWVGIIVAIGTDATSNFWEVKSNGTTAFMHSSLDGGVTWTPSASGFDGVFQILGECNEAITTLPCEIVETGNNFENAEFGLHVKHIANDFDIAEGSSIQIEKIIPTIVNNIGAADIFIYEDNNGQPGNIITSFAGVVPTSQTQVSTNFNLPWYEVELDFPSPVTLEGLPGGSKYWLGLYVYFGTDATSNFWEVKSNGSTAYTHSSLDGGVTWTPSPSGFDGVFQIIGECTGDIVIEDIYCAVETNIAVAPITKLTFAGIDNTTNADPTSPSHEYFLNNKGNVEQGSEYQITVEGNTNGNFTSYFTAFIDWNQNEILDDAGEIYEIGTITNSTGTDGQQATSNIYIPINSDINDTRIRIIKTQDSYALDPCSSIDIGQTEDYTITIAKFQDTYCEVDVAVNVNPITRVLFSDIDNASSPDITSPKHEYFLNIEGNIEKGHAYDITVEGNTDGSLTQYFTAFIDWNQNGILNDAGEIYEIGTLTNSTGTDGQQATTTIDVPLGVLSGSTRIRIIQWQFQFSYDPCMTIAFGQAEDYILNVTEYTNPYCEVVITDTVTPITNVSFAGIQNTTSEATTSPAQEIFIDINGAVAQGNEYLMRLEGVTAGDNTHYFTAFFDWNQNGILDDAGEVYELGNITNSTGTDGIELLKKIQVPEDALLGETRMKLIKSLDASPLDPCGTYTSGQSEDYSITVFDYCLPDIPLKAPITRVIFAGIDNSSPSDPFTAPSYEPFLDIEANVLTGETYDVTLQGNPIWDICYSVFIDWNQNGILDDAGEVYEIDCVGWVPGGGEGELALGTIDVPQDAVTGKTRMRVMANADSGYSLDPCGSYYYGQAEDYTVVVRNTPIPVCEIECPQDIVVEIAVGQTGTVVDYNIDFDCDNTTDVALKLLNGLPSGSEFPVGETTVTFNLEHEGEVINTCEFTVTVQAVLSTEGFEENTFKVYPNPVNALLNISAAKAINTIQVFDLAGKKVFSESPRSRTSQINVSGLEPGVYLMKLISDDSVSLVKVIKM
ncbi:GEVED domain-containing protein [Aequorivita sp. Q41]|uniref:GEVED domain-containing protein n=1 Tax=Aequorivita sp. Q41 TaxID=3153300 RepID=UPI0032420E8B